MCKTWQAKLLINTEDIIHNICEIKKYVGEDVEIMPVIKDSAYGTGIDTKIELFNKARIKIVGVAITDEAIELREAGYTKDIFILNPIYEEDITQIAKYNIAIGLASIDFLKKIGEHLGDFRIHIEVETGMGRTGIEADKVLEFITIAKGYPNIKIEGIYTHFSSSEFDKEFTKKQLEIFDKTVLIAKKECPDLKYIHCCNSGGIINHREAHFNMVRPGIILYGYLPDSSLAGQISLKPAITLKSKVSFIKQVDCGVSISYGRRFITQRKSKIATIQLGYADGIRRSMSNKGSVVIRGRCVPIIGSVCMDCFMADITDLDEVYVGDDVFIWDNQNITVEDIAKIYDTINYEVLSTVSKRVVREYV